MGTAEVTERRLAELEARVAMLEDERQLRDLLAAYSFTADLYRGPDWVELWTDDGVYDLGDQNRPDAYTGRFTGPDELLALITGDGMPPPGRSQHHVHGPVTFRIDGDHATAEGYSVTFVQGDPAAGDGGAADAGDQKADVWTIGFSRWTFHRVDGRWKIGRRDRRELGAADQADVISRPT